MIQSALVFIKNKLDQYLTRHFDLHESIAVLNHLVNQDGSFPEKNKNKMLITLINLDYETHKQFQSASQRLSDNGFAKMNPSVQFNIDMLCTASFDDYEESLKFLSATIAFFQSHNTFNIKTTPDIPQGIKTLTFEIENTSYFETHNLWSAMGAKYQPSIIYKVRQVSIQTAEPTAFVNSVTDADVNVKS